MQLLRRPRQVALLGDHPEVVQVVKVQLAHKEFSKKERYYRK
jgi:hypothetical protein